MDTIWSAYSSEELCKAFAGNYWNNLDTDLRAELLREVEIRLAAERNSEPREIEFKDLEGFTLGYQSGDTIVINRNLVEIGAFRTEVLNKETNEVTTRYDMAEAVNWNLLATVFHEDTHGVQEDEGRGQSVRSYIEADSDYLLYRLGPDEREAFDNGQGRTAEVINYLRTNGIVSDDEDPSMQNFMNEVMQQSTKVYEERAIQEYSDPDVIKHIDQWVNEEEQGLAHDYSNYVAIMSDDVLMEQKERHYQEYLDSIGQGHNNQTEINNETEKMPTPWDVVDNDNGESEDSGISSGVSLSQNRRGIRI